jgi:uncharacterized membrane protein
VLLVTPNADSSDDAAAGSLVGEVEPFLRDVASETWHAFKRNPVIFVGGSWLAALVSCASIGLLSGPMMVGFILVVHRTLHGQSTRVRDVFEGLQTGALVGSVLAALMIAIASVLGFLLFVIPGLFVTAATCFVFHELAYRKLTAVEAIKASFGILKARLLHVLLLLAGIAALNALGHVAVLGILLTVPFSVVCLTVAYEKLSGQTTGSQLATVTEQ